ncbi:DUF6266 family protein [Pedobacter cryoconitis]|uniref:Uncharacterized protein n=1 Tax=Pedobacter cryoconitis TaxID=188932 RepID=A0A7X0J4L7_9SPHI|nr:DUF6266 family protein [Pedobacter cryoconitis]MBB6501051.1 hypothetical protein [Pedobacter cryoconitis]
MAKADDGLFGGLRGSIRNLVFYKYMGQPCVKTKPQLKKKGSRTLPQQAQNNKLKLLSPFLTSVKSFLSIGFEFKAKEQNKTANNQATSINLLNGIKGIYPDQEINWNEIYVADGDLARPENVQVTMTADSFQFNWERTTGSEDDRSMILVYCHDNNESHFSFSGARRAELKDVFTLRSRYIAGKTFEVFIAFKNIISNEVSRSVYCGRHAYQP